MMAAYHRLITPTSTTRQTTPPTLGHIQYYLFLIASLLPQLPSPLFLFLYTTTSIVLSPHSFFFYPSQSFNPKPCMFYKHTHSRTRSHPPILLPKTHMIRSGAPAASGSCCQPQSMVGLPLCWKAFWRIPLLNSSTGLTASRSHQATTCT